MSEVPEQQKNVLELMAEMLKEQEGKSSLTNSAIQAQNCDKNSLNGISSLHSLSSNNDALYIIDSKVREYAVIFFVEYFYLIILKSTFATQNNNNNKITKKPSINNNNNNSSHLKPLNIASNTNSNLNSAAINKTHLKHESSTTIKVRRNC